MRRTKRFELSRRYLPFLFVLVAGAGCGPEGTKLEGLDRRWEYFGWHGPGGNPLTNTQEQREGIVRDHYDFGDLVLPPPGVKGPARGEVFSNETGATYWVSAQAPAMQDPKDNNGASTNLIQEQFYQKVLPGASLKVSLTKIFIEAIDANTSIPPSERQCLQMETTTVLCEELMEGIAQFKLEVTNTSTGIKFLVAKGEAELFGRRGAWDYKPTVDALSTARLWNDGSFVLERDIGELQGQHATLQLAKTIEIPIPLDKVGLLEELKVHVEVSALAMNNRQHESYLSVYFRDPIEDQGVTMDIQGLNMVPPPANPPPEQPPPSPPACPTEQPDPAAGEIAFVDTEPVTSESASWTGEATVLVARTGGTTGEVSALVTTGGGTAVAGVDYTPETVEVRFLDGEAGTRAVRIPILNNTVQEPNRTVELTLSRPRGCAALGAQTQATLTIFDDDAPPVPPMMFEVGGTVSGLVGTGLVLQDGSRMATPSGATFSFGRSYMPGEGYDVRVATQPTGPRQTCTVANGKGDVSDHDVTDVEIACVTVPDVAGLDPTFGTGGRSKVGSPEAVVALAVQPDGKIVTISETRLARYTADGVLDATFGTGGEAPIQFQGSGNDQALGLALQPDGKIVVAGGTGPDQKQAFAIARYTTSGQPDPGFGQGTTVATDFGGSFARASAVLVQPDGKLVVAGQALGPGSTTATDFAAARFTAAGDLDGDFGTGGKVLTDLAGGTEIGYAAALQANGAIVVAGTAADARGENADIGLVRYDARGVPDESFGTHGVVRAALTKFDDVAKAVAIQPDGKIVVSTSGQLGSSAAFMAARFDAAGKLDTGFGSNGVAGAAFGPQTAGAGGLALQADGKIVVVGSTLNSGTGDFGVARFTADGQPDATFGTGGTMAIDFFGAYDAAQAVAIQADGRIVVGGSAIDGAHVGAALVRLLP